MYKTWVWPYHSWHLHLITYVRIPMFLLQCQREVFSGGSLIKSPEFQSNHLISAKTDGWNLINRGVIADSFKRVKDGHSKLQDLKFKWRCTHKSRLKAHPLPEPAAFLNRTVLMCWRACISACVTMMDQQWVWLCRQIHQEDTQARAINLLAACRQYLHWSVDLSHLSIDSCPTLVSILHFVWQTRWPKCRLWMV